jgi:hypothetical protein
MKCHDFKKSSYFKNEDENLSNYSDFPNLKQSEHRQDYTSDINVTTLQFPHCGHVLWGGEQLSSAEYLSGIDVLPLFVFDDRNSDVFVEKLSTEFSDLVDIIPTVEVVQMVNFLHAKHMNKNDLPSALRRSDYTFSLTNNLSTSKSHNLCHLSVPVIAKSVSEQPLTFDALSTT